jgi:hypothetical protein
MICQQTQLYRRKKINVSLTSDYLIYNNLQYHELLKFQN